MITYPYWCFKKQPQNSFYLSISPTRSQSKPFTKIATQLDAGRLDQNEVRVDPFPLKMMIRSLWCTTLRLTSVVIETTYLVRTTSLMFGRYLAFCHSLCDLKVLVPPEETVMFNMIHYLGLRTYSTKPIWSRMHRPK